ncbi:phosphopantetheine-binding protein [Streptomyces sp. NPDC048611]|uniref:phosphopantetheine-binding protein n=1 Tax=Streptomyces sp. NPDC048611 TaxID=3155635 RepID=UPI0034357C91
MSVSIGDQSRKSGSLSDIGSMAGASAVWTAADVTNWIVEYLDEELALSAAEVDRDATFSSLGLGSQAAAAMVSHLGRQLGRDLPVATLWAFPTVNGLAAAVVSDSRDYRDNHVSPVQPVGEGMGEPLAVVSMATRLSATGVSVGSIWNEYGAASRPGRHTPAHGDRIEFRPPVGNSSDRMRQFGKVTIMTSFTSHDLSSAPEGSRPIMENTNKGFGFLPSPIKLMAESPELLAGFMSGNALFNKTTLSPLEREVFILTMATKVECHYCVAMHSSILTRQGADADLVETLRARKPLSDSKLEAMREFTLAVMEGHGHVEPRKMEAFLGAGYTQRNALEVVLGLGVYTISTYANRMTEAPVDEPFKFFEWHGEH